MTGWLLVVAACTCGSPPPAETLPAPRHFGDWESLVRAVARSDVFGAQQLARDLSSGPVAEDHAGAEGVGAALGFLQVADVAEDMPLAISRAAAACGECHAARSVPAPVPPGWSHAGVAQRAVYGSVWHDAGDPPPGPAIEKAVRTAWAAPDRASAVLEACQFCHATKTPQSP